MSIVACRIIEDGYEIAADSIKVRGWTQSKDQNTSLSKLFEVNGLVIGGVGNAEELSLLRLFAGNTNPQAATERDMLEFFSEFSDWKNKKIEKRGIDNSYIIGVQDKVFITSGWLIDEVKTFEAIGAGFDFALSAMHLGHGAVEAVETAIELSVYCEGPVIVIRKFNK